jgi:biopolymer transport protein ExbD
MSFAQPTKEARRALPLAPMLDVMFLLLMFFVTTASFREEEQQVDVTLAATKAGAPAEARRTEVVVNVKDDGSILVGGAAYNIQQLSTLLRDLIAEYPGEHVVIRGDKRVPYERVVQVVDAARSVGVRNVSLATVKRAADVGVQ